MKKNAPVSSPIKFRNKFANKISKELEMNLLPAVSVIQYMSSEKALNTLWRLTYQPEEGLKMFDLTSVETVSENSTFPFTGPALIPIKLIPSFRNELRYQRTLIDKEFTEVTVPESCQQSFEELCKATDSIVAKIVFIACDVKTFCFDETDFNRCLFLLNSNQEKNRFGGIRVLDFNYDEANYLKPYSVQIANLLAALWEEKKQNDSKNLPFACLSPLLEKQTDVAPNEEQTVENIRNTESHTEETPVAEEEVKNLLVSTKTENQPLTAAAIVVNEKDFETFFTACNTLKEKGFNLEQVLSNLEAISKILDGAKALV